MRGVFTGFTVSIILFLAGMNVILEFVSAAIDISVFQSLLSPPVKAFIMDDLFLMSPSLQQTQVLQNHAAIVLCWARMSVKPFRSRNLVFVKGKTLNGNALSFKVNRSMYSIPPISERPIRFLGRSISDSLLDRNDRGIARI